MRYPTLDYRGRVTQTVVETVRYIPSLGCLEIVYDMYDLRELVEDLSLKHIKFAKYISFEIIGIK